MELTREAIIDWLKQQPKDRVIGNQENYSCDCVVACYLRDQGYPNADVDYDMVWPDGDRTQEGTRIPEEVQEIISTFDRLPGYDHTIAETLAALEGETSL